MAAQRMPRRRAARKGHPWWTQRGAPRPAAADRVESPQAKTTERREAVLKAAMSVFGERGYNKGALVEVAERAGMTHAGVLHHFGARRPCWSRCSSTATARRPPASPAARRPKGRPSCAPPRHRRGEHHRRGVVQTYSVLSGESVTEGTPRTTTSRSASRSSAAKLAGVLGEVCGQHRRPGAGRRGIRPHRPHGRAAGAVAPRPRRRRHAAHPEPHDRRARRPAARLTPRPPIAR